MTSPLITVDKLSKSHRNKQLFSDLSFGVFPQDKIGIVGPNGAGKSTLLRLMIGEDAPDSGTLSFQKNCQIGYVAQHPEFKPITVQEVVEEAYTARHSDGWSEASVLAKTLLTRLGFSRFDEIATKLSGGWQKRLQLAQALINSPDLLLLDEPTNHLDLSGILWLEGFLKNAPFAYVVISHDREFLDKTTKRMFEINSRYPSGVLIREGSFSQFVKEKELYLQSEQANQQTLKSKVRREAEWLKQNPKARTVKASSRVQEAHALIEELGETKRRTSQKKVELGFAATERETKKLLSAKNLSKTLSHRPLFQGLDLTLSPGSRIALLGLNGTGKTTLLKILAQEIEPDLGTLKLADGIKVVYFDQHRLHIPLETRLEDALSPTGDTVIYQGRPIHVNGWCRRFLFTPDLLKLPLSHLSGGERARVLIARLMLEPADILLLDEPTNDLDIETVEVLEESLLDFPGAVVLITHDRALMDSIADQVLVLGEHITPQFFADYRQWLHAPKKEEPKIAPKEKPTSTPSAAPKPVKMSFKEKKELEEIEGKILSQEALAEVWQDKITLLQEKGASEELTTACQKLHEVQEALEALFARWQDLDAKART